MLETTSPRSHRDMWDDELGSQQRGPSHGFGTLAPVPSLWLMNIAQWRWGLFGARQKKPTWKWLQTLRRQRRNLPSSRYNPREVWVMTESPPCPNLLFCTFNQAGTIPEGFMDPGLTDWHTIYRFNNILQDTHRDVGFPVLNGEPDANHWTM
jgi:hypothetical protein